MHRTMLVLAAALSVLGGHAVEAGMVIDAAPSTAGNPWWTCPDKSAGEPGDEMAQYYPDKAQRLNMNGQTTIQCRFAKTGRPIACTWISEDPQGYDFGLAGSRLGCVFKLKPEGLQDAPPGGVLVNIPVRMKVPGT
jgi:protein TonB